MVEGMTLRDWFAGQALAGLCANECFIRQTRGYYGERDEYDYVVWRQTFEEAYRVADEMIKIKARS